MDVYFGVGGELLTPLDEMLDGDIKLSLELDLELKEPINPGVPVCTDWEEWSDLTSSPSCDIFGDRDCCSILVSPESVMPFIKREIKQEPPSPSPPEDGSGLLQEDEEISLSELIIKNGVEGDYNDDRLLQELEEEEIEEEESESEVEETESEEEEEEETKLEPIDRSLWNSSLLTKPEPVKTESVPVPPTPTPGRQRTEIVVAKPSSINTNQSTIKVLHATKKGKSESSPVNHRAMLAKRAKEEIMIAKRAKEEILGGYPKPTYSYSCLIAMALKNSVTGSLPVSEIYNFMCEHFPYFKSAPTGWKNSVRHNLSLNKCFEKIEKGGGAGGCRKGCLWAMNPSKISKMDEEVAKWSKKDPAAIRRSMKNPDELEKLERGDLKIGAMESDDSGAEDESESESEAEEVPPSLKRFDSRLSSQESNDLGLPDEMYEELGLLEEVMSSDPESDPPQPIVKRMRLGVEPYARQTVRPV